MYVKTCGPVQVVGQDRPKHAVNSLNLGYVRMLKQLWCHGSVVRWLSVYSDEER